MPGHHVAVYSAFMHVLQQGVAIPGFVYFVSTPSHTTSSYEVYVKRLPSRYPVLNALYHGRVGSMDSPLPRRRVSDDYEVCFYFANYYGSVDCYSWRPDYPPHLYVKWEVTDIHDPNDWFYGSRYVYVGVESCQPLSRKARAAGFRRFYRSMRLSA